MQSIADCKKCNSYANGKGNVNGNKNGNDNSSGNGNGNSDGNGNNWQLLPMSPPLLEQFCISEKIIYFKSSLVHLNAVQLSCLFSKMQCIERLSTAVQCNVR